ncbi:MAG: hypothetical protein LQ337_004642 [Flavoplaca oasis]|nr:MAG: hypothetical protein LQ337_004642 [Flavoplaca oasis]
MKTKEDHIEALELLLEEAYKRNYLRDGSRALLLLVTGLEDLERQAVEIQDTGGTSDSEVPRITPKPLRNGSHFAGFFYPAKSTSRLLDRRKLQELVQSRVQLSPEIGIQKAALQNSVMDKETGEWKIGKIDLGDLTPESHWSGYPRSEPRTPLNHKEGR